MGTVLGGKRVKLASSFRDSHGSTVHSAPLQKGRRIENAAICDGGCSMDLSVRHRPLVGWWACRPGGRGVWTKGSLDYAPSSGCVSHSLGHCTLCSGTCGKCSSTVLVVRGANTSNERTLHCSTRLAQRSVDAHH